MAPPFGVAELIGDDVWGQARFGQERRGRVAELVELEAVALGPAPAHDREAERIRHAHAIAQCVGEHRPRHRGRPVRPAPRKAPGGRTIDPLERKIVGVLGDPLDA